MESKILELDNIDIKIELENITLNILCLRFAPPDRIKHIGNHCHSGYELHYITYGKGKLITGGVTYPVVPETVYLTGPNIYHEQKGDSEDSMAEYCINFEILENSNIQKGKKNRYRTKDIQLIEKTLFETSFWFGKNQYSTMQLFERLLEEINEKHIGYYFNIKNYLSIILINTIRCYCNDQHSPDLPPTKNIIDKRRLIIDSYLQDNWNSRSVHELANMLGVSIRQLNRIFIGYYRMPFGEKITQTRMQNAVKYILESDMPISQISQLVGYDDFGYFCRVFKKHFSVTALQFRNNNCKNEK